MLSKLMKYEFKATGRTLWPVSGAFLLIAIVNSFFSIMELNMQGDNAIFNTISGVSIFMYILAMFALIVVTYFVIVTRFYKNDLSTEGYLTHTLPVSTHQELASKTIVGSFWMIISGIVVILSVLIILIPLGVSSGGLTELTDGIARAWQELTALYGGNIPVIIIEIIVLLIINSVNGVLSMYTALALGHTFKKNKVLAAFGMYILINIIVSFLTGIIAALAGSIFGDALAGVSNINIMHLGMLGSTLLITVFTIIFYFITHYILENKLNLE